MFNNITRSDNDFIITNSAGIVGPDGRGYSSHQYNSLQVIPKLLAKDNDGVYFLRQSNTPAYTQQTDFDYRRFLTPNTDITLTAVCSIPSGRGDNSFGYSPITLRGSNDGTSFTYFRLDKSTWYERENLNDRLVLYILSTETSIEIGNDIGVVLNLQKAIGIALIGDLAGKKFCLMLERVHTGQHNIYINGVLIYNYVDTSLIVSNLVWGRLEPVPLIPAQTTAQTCTTALHC